MFTDRSRILAYQRCPRERFLSYHFAGHGITKNNLNIPLASGTYIHLGLAALLGGASAEEAVGLATESYWEAAHAALGATRTPKEHYLYTVQEQTALVEALVRVYALRGLPALRARYDILGIETEYEFELAPGITFMARLDGELLNRESGEVEVLSFKTDTGNNLDSKIADARIDLQGLTEPEAYQRAHGIRPFGVKMEWLIKGARKEEPKGSGLMRQDSYLIRPWMREGPIGRDYAWRYFWPCPGTEHKLQKADGKSWTCKGEQATHGLGPSYSRVNIWEVMPVKEWLAMLAADQVQPGAGDPFAEALYLPEPIYRTAADQARALRQLQYQEVIVKGADEDAKFMFRASSDLKPDYVDELFPQHAGHNCNSAFGSECQFKDLCFGASQNYLVSDQIPDGFAARTPHHAPELFQIAGQGPQGGVK